MEMSQPATRLSTISSAATTAPVAASTSSGLGSGMSRSRASTKAISASIRGCNSRPLSTGSPGGQSMLASNVPKSGWSTPSCAWTTGLVRPILRPATLSPAASWAATQADWTA